MDSSHHIVPIAQQHIAAFREALDAVAREQRYLAMPEAPPLTKVRRFVLDSLRAGAVHFVALQDGKVIGWCDIRPKAQDTMHHCGVLGMGIVDGHRGRGLGRKLLGMTLDAAFASGMTRIELTVRADNAPAIELYRKFGFDAEGVCRRAMRVDGSYRDTVIMARLA
jgi:RimJ/RimL family protein N-acetyltransferase